MYILLPLVIGYENDAPKPESLSTTGACHLASVLPSVVLPCSGQCLRSLFVVVPGGFIGNIPVVLGSGVLNLSYQTKLLQYHFFFIAASCYSWKRSTENLWSFGPFTYNCIIQGTAQCTWSAVKLCLSM